MPADDYYAHGWCIGGDDSSDASDEVLDDWNVHFAATVADLPACDEDTNGRLYYVEADNQFQVCKTSGWSIIDIQGPMVKTDLMAKSEQQVRMAKMVLTELQY